MAQINPYPQMGHEDTTVYPADRRGRLGALYLMSDGGIWVYGKNVSGGALAVGDLIKYSAALGQFTKTATGDQNLGVQDLSVSQGAPANNAFGYFPMYHPSISVTFTAAAVVVGTAWALSATAAKAKAYASGTVYYGIVLEAVPSAGGTVACSLRR